MQSRVNNEMSTEKDTQKGKNLSFIIEDNIYAIEIKYVRQIIRVQKITVVPEQPKYIKGVINLRGEIIPIIDLRVKFKKEPRKYDARTCIIILDVNQVTVGIIVDRIFEVITTSEDEIAAAPKINSKIQNRFIRGMVRLDQKIYILLECQELIKHDKCDVS